MWPINGSYRLRSDNDCGRCQTVNPCGAETEILQHNKFNIMADTLAPCITRLSAILLLTMQNKVIFVFHWERPAPSQFWDMTTNANIFFCFLNIIQHHCGYRPSPHNVIYILPSPMMIYDILCMWLNDDRLISQTCITFENRFEVYYQLAEIFRYTVGCFESTGIWAPGGRPDSYAAWRTPDCGPLCSLVRHARQATNTNTRGLVHVHSPLSQTLTESMSRKLTPGQTSYWWVSARLR